MPVLLVSFLFDWSVIAELALLEETPRFQTLVKWIRLPAKIVELAYKHDGAIPTKCASPCQCRECGTHLPARMSEEYGSLTPSVERIRDLATPASAGCTLLM
jgi:hypothetical protein